MAKKKRIRDYAEPWTLEKSTLWQLSYKTPPFRTPADDEQRQANADWEAARGKAEKTADVLILGSRLSEAAVATSQMGNLGYCDDRRILTFVRMLGLPDGAPSHEEFAQRVVDCVNAMTGIGDPVAFMGELTAFLEDMSRDPIDEFFHGRATRLLFRIVEQKDLIEAQTEEDSDA
jgi:hypothetical protein